ncbi:STAS/SEC14 domain-containing protein [candidate division WOR-3 bacterium]|nr:STAS/SEC14 domain-containing protein [candidate division WOR-3 bacterium]
MKHKVHYDEKNTTAEVKYVGDISVDDVDRITERLNEVLEGKTERSAISDISESPFMQIGKEAKMKMAEIGKTLNLDRVAVVGANPMNRMMGKIVLALFGKSQESKFFKTKVEALGWLKGEK